MFVRSFVRSCVRSNIRSFARTFVPLCLSLPQRTWSVNEAYFTNLANLAVWSVLTCDYTFNKWSFVAFWNVWFTLFEHIWKRSFTRLTKNCLFSRGNCLLDHGDYYNHNEYASHVSLMPGQLHTPDEQCKLVRGEDSGLCSVRLCSHYSHVVLTYWDNRLFSWFSGTSITRLQLQKQQWVIKMAR